MINPIPNVSLRKLIVDEASKQGFSMYSVFINGERVKSSKLPKLTEENMTIEIKEYKK